MKLVYSLGQNSLTTEAFRVPTAQTALVVRDVFKKHLFGFVDWIAASGTLWNWCSSNDLWIKKFLQRFVC